MQSVNSRTTLRSLRETPALRINAVGPSAVSNCELLGAIIGNPDTALELLNRFQTMNDLARASTFELQGIPGIGASNVAKIKAAFELGRRVLVESPAERPTITSPGDAANLLMSEMSVLEQEEMRVILLDTRSKLIAIRGIYKGSLNTTLVRVGELFRDAIRGNCAAIIVVHNHPSGDPNPSPEDVDITKDIVNAGKLLSVEVLDHLVIGNNRFVSLRERGLGFCQ